MIDLRCPASLVAWCGANRLSYSELGRLVRCDVRGEGFVSRVVRTFTPGLFYYRDVRNPI